MDAKLFIEESNLIEDIHRPPTKAEIAEYHRFMDRTEITVEDLQQFVRVYQPKARLRDKPGLNVFVGDHRPPAGGPEIRVQLEALLESANSQTPFGGVTAWERHVAYEMLHPFTDGNGRSGRMLWLWEMRDTRYGFLRHFYYQTLGAIQREKHAP